MSTKQTLWYSDEFHLYSEGLDDENIYLEVNSPAFEKLVLKIPLMAWKEMRKQTIQPAEQYLNMSDDELIEEALRKVDDHRAELAKIQETGPEHAGLSIMFGSFVFGPPESSRDEMIVRFLQTHRPALAPQLQPSLAHETETK